MTGRAVVREGSCPSVQKGKADVREGRYPGGQVSVYHCYQYVDSNTYSLYKICKLTSASCLYSSFFFMRYTLVQI